MVRHYFVSLYSAGEEKSPLFIFLHDQLPFFLGEIVENFSRFLQEIQYFLQEIPVFLPEILRFCLYSSMFSLRNSVISPRNFSEKLAVSP